MMGCEWLWENVVSVTGWCLQLFVGVLVQCWAIWVVPGFWGFDYWVCGTLRWNLVSRPEHGVESQTTECTIHCHKQV